MQLIDLPRPDAPTALCFSQDGRRLASAAGGRVFVADLVTGAARALWDYPDTQRVEGGGLGFTADGRFVIARHGDPGGQAIVVHDGDTGRPFHRHALPTFNDGFVVEPGAGTVLVAAHPLPGGYTAEFYRWDPVTGEQGPWFGQHRNVLRQLAISADGEWLAGTFGDELRVWRVGGGATPGRAAHRRAFAAHRGPSGFVVSLALSADGALAVAGGYNGRFRLLEVAVPAAHDLGPRPRGVGRDAAFHPSQPLLVFGGEGGEAVVYDAAARAEVRRHAWGVGDLGAVAFSPDGLRCAAAAAGKVVVWDFDA